MKTYTITSDESLYTVYYDLGFRSWVAFRMDANHFQIGDAGYGMSKAAAIEDAKYLASIHVDPHANRISC